MMLALYIFFLTLSLTFFIVNVREIFSLKKSLPLQNKPRPSGFIERVCYPIFAKGAPLFKQVQWKHYRHFLQKQIVKAALQESFTPEIFWCLQVFMAGVFVALYGFLSSYMALFGFALPFHMQYAALFLLLGSLYPLAWLSSKIKKRSKKILRLFPDFVSTLTLSVEAGLDYFAAMVRYLENAEPSPLTEEVQKVVGDVRLGSSREVALKDMSLRLELSPIQTFIAVLVQATRLGTSIGTVLRAQAEKLRRERFEAAERAGAMASQKILFPLVFFIMPAVFLLIFGPLIVRLFTGGLQSLFV